MEFFGFAKININLSVNLCVVDITILFVGQIKCFINRDHVIFNAFCPIFNISDFLKLKNEYKFKKAVTFENEMEEISSIISVNL